MEIFERNTNAEKSVKLVLNPTEFFIMDFAKRNNEKAEDVYQILKYAYEYFSYYEKEGELISNFFEKYASCFDEDSDCDVFENNAEIEERPFTEAEKEAFYDVLDATFYDIDDIVIGEAIEEEDLDWDCFNVEEVEYQLIERIHIERGCYAESDEEFLEDYVDEEFHKYFEGVEEAISKMEYRLDRYVKENFDFNEIAKRIIDVLENGSDENDESEDEDNEEIFA